MNQTTGFSMALAALLASGFALYKRASQIATGLALTAWVALASIERARKKGSLVQKKIARSSSAPDLRGAFDPAPLRLVPLYTPTPIWQPPLAIEPPPQRPTAPMIKLSSLRRRESSFFAESLYRVVFGVATPPAPYPPEIVDGVVDLRGGIKLSLPFDLEEVFGSVAPSLEMGAVKGERGPGWIILVDELTCAQEVRSTQPEALVVAGRYLDLSLPAAALKRIDLRLIQDLGWAKELQNLRLFSPELKEGDELHFIYRRKGRGS